jgi:hypothetical protein
MDMCYTLKTTDSLVARRKKQKRETRNGVGKGSGKSDKTEEFNT